MAASGLILGTMKDSSLNEQLSMFFIGDHGKKFEATNFGRLKTGRIKPITAQEIVQKALGIPAELTAVTNRPEGLFSSVISARPL
jgi:hypothetical protein